MFKQIIEKIEEYNKIIIHVHHLADGDCTGSGLGLKEIIKTTYPEKEVYVVGKEAEYLRFLGDFDIIEDSVYEGALVFVVDTAAQKRVSDQRFNMGDFLIKIDHHVLVEHYGDIEYVDTSSPAASQIITQFYAENRDKLKISKTGRNALYIGILTDTGRFRYRGVDHRTFGFLSLLLEEGIDFEMLNNSLGKESENSIRFRGNLLTNFKKTSNGFAYYIMNQAMLKEFGVIQEEAVSLVNELSKFEDCPVWGIICENPTGGTYRVRLRSKGPQINEFAMNYNGGGHKMACGATLDSKDDINGFLEDVNNFVGNYNKSL